MTTSQRLHHFLYNEVVWVLCSGCMQLQLPSRHALTSQRASRPWALQLQLLWLTYFSFCFYVQCRFQCPPTLPSPTPFYGCYLPSLSTFHSCFLYFKKNQIKSFIGCMCACTHVQWHSRETQRINWVSEWVLSFCLWVPGVKLGLWALTAGAFTHRVIHNPLFFKSILIHFLLSLYINIQLPPLRENSVFPVC